MLWLCLFFHRWGKWTHYSSGTVSYHGKVQGKMIIQQRWCSRCEYFDYRKQEIVLR